MMYRIGRRQGYGYASIRGADVGILPLMHWKMCIRDRDKGIYIDMASQEWYALDSVPLRGVPYIGEIKPGSQEYVIYGFQKWGMTLSQVAAKLIKDLILQQENPYKSLYSCQYFSLSFAKEYQKKIMNSYYNGFIYPRFHYKKVNQIQNGEGAIAVSYTHLL